MRGGSLALIPARGGSRRIPRKNLRPLGGIPLLIRTIRCLRDSGIFDRIVVSTDDKEISEIATSNGAECPFLRPAHLADDFASTAEVVLHAISQMEQPGNRIEDLCVAYPSLGLVLPSEFGQSKTQVISGHSQHVISAVQISSEVSRSWLVDGAGLASPLVPKFFQTRSQDLPPIFADAGQFYWSTKEAWELIASGIAPTTTLCVLPVGRCHDINSEEDWRIAEMKIADFR